MGIDWYTYGRFKLSRVYCGAHLLIDGVVVLPEEILWIREIHLRALKNSWTFVEFVFLRNGSEVRALCMGKPDRLFKHENRTISMVLQKLPELKERLAEQGRTYHFVGVNELPRPQMNQEATEFQVDPMARYRDPYFRRKR